MIDILNFFGSSAFFLDFFISLESGVLIFRPENISIVQRFLRKA